MSNEEQVADTIEMLYERLNSYNKQDLFNYGYLLESNEILRKDIEEKDKEIERLKQGYCELKEKCNKGECDCTHEEYNGMCEQNIKMDLEIERLNNIINEFEDFITNVDSHINLGDESEEFILVRDKWLELQELKGVKKND